MQIESARILAGLLMHQHGVGDWEFGFDRASKRAGVCYFGKRRITVSEAFVELNSIEQVKDTILHEIAHAIAGYDAGHGPVWQQCCLRIGAEPRTCYSSKDVAMPTGRWAADCPCCGQEFRRHRRPKALHFCMKCGSDRGSLVYEERL